MNNKDEMINMTIKRQDLELIIKHLNKSKQKKLNEIASYWQNQLNKNDEYLKLIKIEQERFIKDANRFEYTRPIAQHDNIFTRENQTNPNYVSRY